MRYIYNFIYLVLFATWLPVLLVQKYLRGKSRPGIWSKFLGKGPARSGSKPCVLFHAVSLGEVSAIGKLVVDFQKLHPGFEVIVSTTTQTGYDAANKSFPDLEVCLFPFDFSWAVRRFIRNLNPSLIVLAELEIWPNLLAECKRKSITTCLVNGRMSEKSCARYRRLAGLFRHVFSQIDLICVQNQAYQDRFKKLGVAPGRVTITGNLKYDSLLQDRSDPDIARFRSMASIQHGQVVFLAGSTQSPEESMAIDTYLELEKSFPGLRLFLCPRHPERFDEVAGLLESRGILFSRRSSLKSTADFMERRTVLLDSVGELRYWWGISEIAMVGGSFGNRGGQNMMEPAALGSAVCFGPNTRNFEQEVQALKTANAAVELKTGNQLTAFVQRCLAEPGFRKKLGANSRQLVQGTTLRNATGENRPSTTSVKTLTACRKTIHAIDSLIPDLEKPSQSQHAA